ncbi:hypothetical protein C8P68_10384 [Mucilaginibacter yixingensis]|uniref:Surface antigen-like protein n=1 Tax=Mucilaginibacter yixingensis TaxID=1295612 RepID=A0A2T5JAP4_9SPHI|nr:hypothetical protein [Mucilaginibacter yixingensis]PTQ97925.1 hypothetical protein C8P68_10384 [Mucilaginibacter yixingensis]
MNRNFLKLIPCLLLLAAQLHAQEKKPRVLLMSHPDTVSTTKRDTDITEKGIPQHDMGDLYRQIFHKTPVITDDSVTTKPELSIMPAVGYTLTSGFAVALSGNMAFRTGPHSRISTILASGDYTAKKQFTIPVQTNIWTRNNAFNFVGEYKFFKYPQSTYGLGSSSGLSEENPMDYTFFRFYQIVMHRITDNFYLGGGYIYDNRWNISEEGNLNGKVSDYSLYGKSDKAVSTGFTVNSVFDTRDNSIYPLKGFYAGLQYRDNLTWMGSSRKWSSLIVDLRKFFRFPGNSNNVLGIWSYNWLILNGKPDYLELPSTSWDTNTSTGRGYIQGRFRGAQMIYLEAEYRYQITRDGLLGGVVFVNAESFSAAPGTPLQRFQPAFGPGLRIKLNKTSRTNLAVDYGFGKQGMNGLFIDVGEVF